MARSFFKGVGEILKFGWPLVLWLLLVDPFWEGWFSSFGHPALGAASSPLLLVGLCVVILGVDSRNWARVVVSAAYVTLTSFWSLVPIFEWSISTIGRSGFFAWLKLTEWLIVLSMVVSFVAGTAMLAFATPGVVRAARAARSMMWGKRLKFETSTSNLHGDARMATEVEMRPLTEGKGTIVLGKVEMSYSGKRPMLPRLGRWNRALSNKKDWRLVKWPLEAHLVTLAPTRSGKGTSMIIPTVMTYPWGIVVNDTKAESLIIAGRARREMGHRVIAIDPFGIRAKFGLPGVTDHFNPLDAIEGGSIADIDTLLDAVMPAAAAGKSEGGDHFRNSAIRLLRGLIYYTVNVDLEIRMDKAAAASERAAMRAAAVTDADKAKVDAIEEEERRRAAQIEQLVNETPENKRIPPVRTLNWVHWILSAESAVFNATLDSMIKMGGPAATAANMLRSAGEKERGSIMTTTQIVLNWMDIPEMASCISKSTFNLSELTEGTADIFICIPPERLIQAASLMRLMSSVPLSYAMKHKPKRRLLFILDEAPLVGRLESIVSMFRVGAGMNLSVWVFAQTVKDLEAAYPNGEAQGLLGNAEAIPVFGLGQNNPETCEWLSKSLGDTTVIMESVNEGSGQSAQLTHMFSATNRSKGKSLQEGKRPLRLPTDIAQMPADRVIVLTRAKCVARPLEIRQAPYFSEPEFAGRFDPNPYFDGGKDPEPKAEAVPKPEAVSRPEAVPAG